MLNVTLKPTTSETATCISPVIAWILSNLDGYEQETQLTLRAGYPLTFSFSCLQTHPFFPPSSMIYSPLGTASSVTPALGLLSRLQVGAAQSKGYTRHSKNSYIARIKLEASDPRLQCQPAQRNPPEQQRKCLRPPELNAETLELL